MFYYSYPQRQQVSSKFHSCCIKAMLRWTFGTLIFCPGQFLLFQIIFCEFQISFFLIWVFISRFKIIFRDSKYFLFDSKYFFLYSKYCSLDLHKLLSIDFFFFSIWINFSGIRYFLLYQNFFFSMALPGGRSWESRCLYRRVTVVYSNNFARAEIFVIVNCCCNCS